MKYRHIASEKGSKTAKRWHATRARRGSFLVESAISLFLLVAVAMVLVDSSLNILRPRNWVMKQNLVDAFLSQEVALANRVDFETISNGTSAWGAGNAGSAAIANAETTNNVTMGLLPSFTLGGAGRPYPANVYRVRIPIQSNNAVASFAPSAANTLSLQDLGIRVYELQTHVEYELGGNTYVRSRSVIRSQ